MLTNDDTQYYYCSACGSVYYIDDDNESHFIAWVADDNKSLCELEVSIKNCGCNQ